MRPLGLINLAAGLVLFAALCGPWTTLAAETEIAAAIFDFELIDSSLEGETSGVRPDETARLKLISDQLREQLAGSGRYRVVDLAPAADKIEDAGYIHGCNGCDAAIARTLGARIAFTGTVQKVSNLILNINIHMRDASTGKSLGGYSADIRGNTDQSWSRGVSYLVRNRILRK